MRVLLKYSLSTSRVNHYDLNEVVELNDHQCNRRELGVNYSVKHVRNQILVVVHHLLLFHPLNHKQVLQVPLNLELLSPHPLQDISHLPPQHLLLNYLLVYQSVSHQSRQ